MAIIVSGRLNDLIFIYIGNENSDNNRKTILSESRGFGISRGYSPVFRNQQINPSYRHYLRFSKKSIGNLEKRF